MKPRKRKEMREKKNIDTKPNIFWRHTPFKNGGDTVRIKIPSW